MALPLLYPHDAERLLSLADELVRHSRTSKQRVALVESCTGGLGAGILSAVPGSSSLLDRAWVVYSNEAKTELLGLNPEILLRFGAVSAPCAAELARLGLAKSQAGICVSITGIAGPGGGSPAKPVGTVFIARASPMEKPEVFDFQFEGDRSMIRARALEAAFGLLLR